MSKFVPGINDLLTTHPELTDEWDYEKNDPLRPDQVMAGSGKRVWWKCSFGHEWKTAVYHRKAGHGCPYCSGRKAMLKKGSNDLKTVNPELSLQWDYEHNDPLGPDDVTIYSQIKVWWLCEKGHHWLTSVAQRTRGRGCPYCAGQKLMPGFNDLSTTHPELAKEWNYIKNGNLIPKQVMAGSDQKVWWRCKEGHEWQAYLYSRKVGSGCPYCSGNLLIKGISDLKTFCNSLAAEWDMEKNSETPDQVPSQSNKKVWWKCSEGHSWKAKISSRTNGRGCPYCANKKVLRGYNDLATTNPDICNEWDSEMNQHITPFSVTAKSHKRVWWNDSFGHVWQASVANRVNGTGCPYCAGRIVLPGFNDLKSQNPVLASEWHLQKNGTLLPDHVTVSSNRQVWWLCSKGHSWRAEICSRREKSCPYCSNRKAWTGYNDLTFIHPEIADEWDYDRNKSRPEDVTFSTNKQYWWKCSLGHHYKLSVYKRHKGQGCPYCSGVKVLAGFNDLGSVSPWLLEEWDYERNADLKPENVLPFTNKKAWWKCKDGHHWKCSIGSRQKGTGCPYCSGHYSYKSRIVP